MITVNEIRSKAENIYTEVLRAAISGTPMFPKTIRSNKVLAKDFSAMHRELQPLIDASKDVAGYGYTIQYRQVNTRLHGSQHVPETISFGTLEDYLAFTGKKKAYTAFSADTALILGTLPQLQPILLKNPLLVIQYHGEWPELIRVCQWFMEPYLPDHYYIRELPIAVHTKFIESRQSIFRILLDALIPEKVDPAAKDFEEHFRLRFAEPLVRLRFLDPVLGIAGLTDISLPLSEFAGAVFPCERLIITENKMNFLTLPELKGTIAIWGVGYGIGNLKNVSWLRDLPIYYWGDLDEHGMAILSQLRTYFPHTLSLMMDMATLKAFEIYWHKGSVCQAELLPQLNVAESETFAFIKQHAIRLEQEKIPQAYVDELISLSLK